MNDKVIQIEIMLNFLNTLFAKAVFLKNNELINELNILRHDIYYGDNFNYELIIKKLQYIEIKLKIYE